MEVGDKFTHNGIEYTAKAIFDNGEVEGRAMVHIGAEGASPKAPKVIIIHTDDISG